VVIYPDIFSTVYERSDVDEIERWASVSTDMEFTDIVASLPLARVMGAFVVSQLGANVTHVLGDMITDEPIEYEMGTPIDCFRRTIGRDLLDRLLATSESTQPHQRILLISPTWLRNFMLPLTC
jgi:hypothetical protein